MRVIVGGRQAGKTRVLVEELKGGTQRPDGSWTRVMVTLYEREAERLRRDFHLDKRQVISNESVGRMIHHGIQRPEELLVDNIDQWFYETFGQMPNAVTSTESVVTWGIGQAQAVQHAVESALSAWEGGLIEDDDGAPYPEEVQELARALRLKMAEVDGLLENMQRQVAIQKNKARRNEEGLLGMLASQVLDSDHGER